MPKMPKKCPACNTDLVVTRLTCPQCATEVAGSYPLDLFARLEPNDFDFIVLFVKTKGNIKEMERELGISYWTIRSKLNDLVIQLGLDNAQPVLADAANRREQILEQLNAGLISVPEAAALLEKLKKYEF
jgi:hypothetical protein